MNWSQCTQMDAAINWTLPWRRSSESVLLTFDLANKVKKHRSSRCRRHRTHILASLDQQAGSHSGTAAWEEANETAGKTIQRRSENAFRLPAAAAGRTRSDTSGQCL